MSGVPVFWVGCFLLAALTPTWGACGKRTTHPSADGKVGGALAVGHSGPELPPVCEEYRRKLLRCVESGHFPQAAKAGQRLALEQMLAIVRQEQGHGDGATADVEAASQNCRDSLSTLSESAKITCPEVF